MEKWAKLPSEILDNIFSILINDNQSQDLWQCAMTCYNWKVTAHTFCFAKLTLRTIEDIDKFIQLVSRTYNPGIFVKILKIENASTIEESSHFAYMLSIATLFPNIEELVFTTDDDRLYSAFHHIFCINKFPYLKRVPTSNNCFQDKLYLECVDLHRDRNRNIDLIQGIFDRDTYTLLHKNLDQFDHLKTINVEISCGETESAMNYVETLTTNNKLLSLRELNLSLYSPLHTILIEKPDIIQPAVNLDHLNISCYGGILYFGDDNSMLYTIKKFPNLQQLQITSTFSRRGTQLVLYTTPTLSVVIEFLKYLADIPECSVSSPIITDHHTAEIVNQIYNYLGMKEFIYQPRSTKNKLTILNDKTQFIEESAVNRSAVIEFSQDLRKGQTREIRITLKKQASNRTQLLQILEQSGRFIHELLLDSAPSAYGDASLVDHIIRDCIYLNQLTLRHIFDVGFDVVKSYSVKVLILENMELSTRLFSQISERFPYLKTLVIDEKCYFEWGFQHLHINMSPSDFECLHIKTHYTYPDIANRGIDWKGIYIRLVTVADSRVRYCFLVPTKETFSGSTYTFKLLDDCPSSKAEFQARIEDDRYWYYYINCQSVERIKVDYYSTGGVLRSVILN